MQKLIIQSPPGDKFPPVHCIACGRREDPASGSYCAHLQFVFLRGFDDFDHVGPAFEASARQLRAKLAAQPPGRAQHLEDLLAALPDSASQFIVEQHVPETTSGAGTFTVLYGFDLSQHAAD